MHPNGQVKETLLVVTDICVPEVEPQALSWEEQHQALAGSTWTMPTLS